jgi:signal transduction histidine kinase
VLDGRVLFRFADNGSGIAPEYRAQVFDLFTRLVPNNIPGTGMGLALVRKIVLQTGGCVAVNDGIDGGTCIAFDLPLESNQ